MVAFSLTWLFEINLFQNYSFSATSLNSLTCIWLWMLFTTRVDSASLRRFDCLPFCQSVRKFLQVLQVSLLYASLASWHLTPKRANYLIVIHVNITNTYLLLLWYIFLHSQTQKNPCLIDSVFIVAKHSNNVPV